ncbi:hypothetical protein RhiirC2_794499 [Rhizophagus irregularis]|uniref:Uncharacterized protein n=1 Tax=Rhizophagus irregularis TaxID=588596 RepID=A0A2N1MDF3_9GLOM|nr:hypothetical protein RhiirC2_794499 [Rhizophagus irregularis]
MICKISDSMTLATLWTEHRPHSFLTNIKGLKSFKIIQTAQGDRKLIGYFERWEDMQTALNNQFSYGGNANKTNNASRSQSTKNNKNSKKDSKKKSSETKSKKPNLQDKKKDKSRKVSRSKILAEILDTLRKLD